MIVSSIEDLGKRIGIFGGSFDPVHNGHIELAQLAKNSLNLDSIIFIPTNQNPLKNKSPLVLTQNRLAMLSLALQQIKGFFVADLECNSDSQASYTVDTLKALLVSSKYKKEEIFLLIGADQIEKFHLWKNYKELFTLSKIIVFGRSGVLPENFASINPLLQQNEITQLSERYIKFDYPISSTELRNWIKAGNLEKCRPFLPADVFDFIKQKRLYN